MKTYDVIVIGLGAMGSAAAYHCAKRGANVLGLDANAPNHTLGSSHGATRAIRETYFESPEYVPLCQRSYNLWRELEQDSGKSLLATNGAIYVGPKEHPMLKGVASAAEQHSLPIERLSRDEVKTRFTGFVLPDGWEGIFEQRGGVLQSEMCLHAHTELARKHGAELKFGVGETTWHKNKAGHFVVKTENDEFESASAILTLGPWACNALRDLNLPINGRRITIVHFDTAEPARYSQADFSVQFWATPEGVYGGFPHIEGEGLKIMRHDTGDVCTPQTARRDVTEADRADVVDFAKKYMPYANGGITKSLVGLYTMTPDNHFIIDRHPEFENVAYATGFSGHGFKFAPVIGEVLADMVLDGSTRHPTNFLKAARFGKS